MKAKLNLQLLKTTTFDSGSLGLLAMVIHQFPAVGNYRVSIRQEGRMIADTAFKVADESEVLQLNFDLAEAGLADSGYNCENPKERMVSPKGYVLFHVSSGSGYSVVVANTADELIFDSTRLGQDDLFAVSLLEPGNYSMTNKLGSAAGEIVVSLPSQPDQQINNLETQYVDVSENEFDPDRIGLVSSQGLVFRIKGSARLLIEKTDTLPKAAAKPVVRWQRPQTQKR